MSPLISNEYLRVMSRYNRWQNSALYAAASALEDDIRREDKGAFWRSIQGTCSHLYWADRIWLSRFHLVERPEMPLTASAALVEDWADLSGKRTVLDELLVEWCDDFPAGPVEHSLTWFSGAAGRDVTAPLSVVLTHLFNHQTHHRGQAHALLTAAGAKTEDTDLFMMPRDLWPADA